MTRIKIVNGQCYDVKESYRVVIDRLSASRVAEFTWEGRALVVNVNNVAVAFCV